MKKTIVTIVALLILGVAGSAQAALFEFTDYVGYNGITDGPLIIDDGNGLTATFTGFSMVSEDSILTDFSWGADAVASIAFSAPVYVDALNLSGGMNFTFESFLNGGPSKDAINYILFALEPTVMSPAMVGIESVEVSATPIPGAVWLLGSGLVGLVGLRRKFTA